MLRTDNRKSGLMAVNSNFLTCSNAVTWKFRVTEQKNAAGQGAVAYGSGKKQRSREADVPQATWPASPLSSLLCSLEAQPKRRSRALPGD